MQKKKFLIKQWCFLFFLISILCIGGRFIYSRNFNIITEPSEFTLLYNDKGPHEESFNFSLKASQNIPLKYIYRKGNTEALKNYLIQKNSNLANEPYFSEIIKQAKTYNLNPCLLFAITGREQAFVPKNHKFVSKISNNPFNVFGSWETYNTSISDSAEIACRTIIKLSKNCPNDENFLKWINSQNDGKSGYAEDIHWHKDVQIFFDKMNNTIY